MSSFAPAPETITAAEAVADEARSGLTGDPKTLSPWLFYDESGSRLFEQITQLPEYYLTRTERSIFASHADEILLAAACADGPLPSGKLTVIELGAGTATKTGILLAAAVRHQSSVVYQPVDVSETALDAARENILHNIAGVTVRPQVADYTREALPLNRLPNTRTLALYIGSSIGNFTPPDARDVLRNLRAQLLPGDVLLLGTDLGPGKHKTEQTLLAAYNDASGTTAAFNRNVLTRLNRDLGTNFDSSKFRHKALWNPAESRIEMHLESLIPQRIRIPADSTEPAVTVAFRAGETIHTENSYKFSRSTIDSLISSGGFRTLHCWQDQEELFAVTLAVAV